MTMAFVVNKWRPILTSPREIRRGKRKGAYEVVVNALREDAKGNWGMVPRKRIVNTLMEV
jgi:hypothetical protein